MKTMIKCKTCNFDIFLNIINPNNMARPINLVKLIFLD